MSFGRQTSFYWASSLRAVPLQATSPNFLISLDNSMIIRVWSYLNVNMRALSNNIMISNGHSKCKRSRRRSSEQTWNLATLPLAVKSHQKVVKKFPKIKSDNGTLYCIATNSRKCASQSTRTDWVFQPTRNETRTTRDLFSAHFPRLQARVAHILIEFWLAASVCYD